MALRFFKVLILISWFIPVLPLWPQSNASEVAKTYEEPEAGAWLALPVPAFTPEAERNERIERLVDWLYKDGAVFVGVVLTEGGSSGSKALQGLRVYLPLDQGSREQIVRVANRENAKIGYGSIDDTTHDIVMIWF